MKRDLPLTEEHLNQEVTVVLRLGDVLRLAGTESMAPPAEAIASVRRLPAAIGEAYQGGIFAGVTLDGDRPAALVLMPGDFKGTWDEAKDWAEKEGLVLPSRIDQLVLFKNVKSEFKDAWYWSAERYAGDEGYAWYQDFGDGSQGCTHRSNTSRARAVRRLVIQ